MTDKLEETLGYMDRLVREDASCNETGKGAFVALGAVARQLGEDPNGRGASFFKTFGRVNIFSYDEGRNANGHGVGYGLDPEGKIVVFVGDSIPGSEGDFMSSFNRNSSEYLDAPQREDFLRRITQDEILRVLSNYRRG